MNIVTKVRIIVPTLKKNKEDIKKILENQTLKNFTLEVVRGIKPPAKARNLGAKKGNEEILIFMDDDIEFSDSGVLERIVNFLQKNKKAGICGAGVRSPQNSSFFQKRLVLEIPRLELPVPQKDTETKEGITGNLFGIRRGVFERVGGFNERLVSGEDPELFYRILKNGYKNYILGSCFSYHAVPSSLGELFKKFFWYGIGHYQSRHLHPEWSISLKISNLGTALLYFLFRTAFLIPHIFLGEISFRKRQFKLSFKPLKALSSYASAIGYLWGFVKYRVR